MFGEEKGGTRHAPSIKHIYSYDWIIGLDIIDLRHHRYKTIKHLIFIVRVNTNIILVN